MQILQYMKQCEKDGNDTVQQHEIVNAMVQKIEVEGMGHSTSVEQSVETSKKIGNVINHLITKENILVVTQDSKIKNERFIAMNINVDLDQPFQ